MNKKNFILVVALAITSLTLFSFRGTEDISNEAEVTEVKEFSKSSHSFTESEALFPDDFFERRKTWTEKWSIEASISLDEMNATLEEF